MSAEPGAPSPLASRLRRRGGLLAAALTVSCAVTTGLMASGAVAAGAGLAGSLELTVAAVAMPVAVLGRHALTWARRRRGAAGEVRAVRPDPASEREGAEP